MLLYCCTGQGVGTDVLESANTYKQILETRRECKHLQQLGFAARLAFYSLCHRSRRRQKDNQGSPQHSPCHQSYVQHVCYRMSATRSCSNSSSCT